MLFGKVVAGCENLEKVVNQVAGRRPRFTVHFLLYLVKNIVSIITFNQAVEHAYLTGWAFEAVTDNDQNHSSPWLTTFLVANTCGVVMVALQIASRGKHWILNIFNWVDVCLSGMTDAVAILILVNDGTARCVQALTMLSEFFLALQLLSRLRIAFLPFAVFLEGCIRVTRGGFRHIHGIAIHHFAFSSTNLPPVPTLLPFILSTFIVLYAFVVLYRTTALKGVLCTEGRAHNTYFCTEPETWSTLYAILVQGSTPTDLFAYNSEAESSREALQFWITVFFTAIANISC
jgi:hypothetical protein